MTGLANGSAVMFQVLAANAIGAGPFSALSNTITPATVARPPAIGIATAGTAAAVVRWTRPANGGSPITGYWVRVVNATTLAQIGALRPATAAATSLRVSAANGTAVRFQVQARNAVGTGAFSARSNAVVPAKTPGAPHIITASSGFFGGPVNAVARWAPPAANGAPPVNGYVVIALRISATGAVLSQRSSAVQAPGVRSLRMTLPSGSYRFVVRARNRIGLSATSARSNQVRAR
jgi:hypothetical protein